MPERCYVDTSAYLAVLLGEKQGKDVLRVLRGAELLSSVLLVLESRRNLIHLSREGRLTSVDLGRAMERLDQDVELFALRDLTIDLCRGTPFPAVTTPRSLDLAHLRTALWFHQREPIGRFVTLDVQQRNAARELDLPV